MISEFDIVTVKLQKRNDKKQYFTFTVSAFDVGDFFEKFLKYFDNYDDVDISFGKVYRQTQKKLEDTEVKECI